MSKKTLIYGAFVALIAAVFLLAATGCGPKSTQGVNIVGKNKARLPAGETFVLTHQVGKVRETWRITYDGEYSVRFKCDGWCKDLDTARLNGIGNIADIGAGWGDHFYLWLRPDGAVNIKWPRGWKYQAHGS